VQKATRKNGKIYWTDKNPKNVNKSSEKLKTKKAAPIFTFETASFFSTASILYLGLARQPPNQLFQCRECTNMPLVHEFIKLV